MATKAPATEVSVDDWLITYRDATSQPVSTETWGKIVLQDHWTLILDPDSRAVLFAVPNVNMISVEPLAH